MEGTELSKNVVKCRRLPGSPFHGVDFLLLVWYQRCSAKPGRKVSSSATSSGRSVPGSLPSPPSCFSLFLFFSLRFSSGFAPVSRQPQVYHRLQAIKASCWLGDLFAAVLTPITSLASRPRLLLVRMVSPAGRQKKRPAVVHSDWLPGSSALVKLSGGGGLDGQDGRGGRLHSWRH